MEISSSKVNFVRYWKYESQLYIKCISGLWVPLANPIADDFRKNKTMFWKKFIYRLQNKIYKHQPSLKTEKRRPLRLV